ncbi:MAG: serine hydrolase domain-containing protein [Myxococcota bacterium]
MVRSRSAARLRVSKWVQDWKNERFAVPIRRLAPLYVLGVLLCSCATSVATGSDQRQDASDIEAKRALLDARVPRWLEEYDVPSAAVAYVVDREVALSQVWGEQAPGEPATPETLYNVASLTKPIVAETVLRLVNEGRLSLDEPLARYWVDPDVADDPRSQVLTPRIVMRHESGLPNWRYETNDVLRFIGDPATEVKYSGEAFEWLAKAVQNKLRTPFEALAKQYVLEPVRMNRTAFVRQPWFEGHLAEPYAKGKELRNVVRDEFLAADDMRTTVSDYARFLIDVMNGGGVSAELASQRTAISRHDPSMERCVSKLDSAPPCPRTLGWTTGWFVLDYGAETIVSHSGGDHGEKTFAFYSPERSEGVVVFTNGANGHHVMFKIAEALYRNDDFAALLRPDPIPGEP